MEDEIPLALLMKPAAVGGKKQFICCEVLVLMDFHLLPEGVCVRDGRVQPQSFLHASVSWRSSGCEETADCSQSPCQQIE